MPCGEPPWWNWQQNCQNPYYPPFQPSTQCQPQYTCQYTPTGPTAPNPCGAPSQVVISFVQGDSYSLQLQALQQVTAPGPCTPGTYSPVNLSNATLIMTASTAPNGLLGSVQLFSISTATGDIVITNAVNGNFTIVIPVDVTAFLVGTQLNFIFDVILETNSDVAGKFERLTILRGMANLLPNISPFGVITG